MRKLFFLAIVLLASVAFADTHTSTQSGNFGTAGTWVSGVAPADGDVIVIAAGHTVHLDADYTGWATGLAASTITGTLDVVQTPGTYGLKLAGTLSGTGKIEFCGATTSTELADNVIVNINSTYNGTLVNTSGVNTFLCKEPSVPVATLKAQYTAGTTKIYLNETLDTVWADGRFVRICNLSTTIASEEFTIVNSGVDGGGQYITLSGGGLAATKAINSPVHLTQRNIQVTGNSGASQSVFGTNVSLSKISPLIERIILVDGTFQVTKGPAQVSAESSEPIRPPTSATKAESPLSVWYNHESMIP